MSQQIMNKKKACIESLAVLEPPAKSSKQDLEAESREIGLVHQVSEEAERDSHHDSSKTLIVNGSTNTNQTTASYSSGLKSEAYETASYSSGLKSEAYEKTSPSNSTTNEKEPEKFIFNGGECGLSDKLINQALFSQEVCQKLRLMFLSSSDYFDDSSGLRLTCHPFKHCILPHFISDDVFVKQLEEELKDQPLEDKNNDLYKFTQSSDLKYSKSSTMSRFRLLCDSMTKFLTCATDIPLDSRIDMFCSHYKYTDVLLCHDDELEERRIAFIYYLVPESWTFSDGGTLDLFDTDEFDQPKDIVKSIVPLRNSFLFFEVSSKSFHQVAEILSEEKTRLSISGWFHGPPLLRPPPHVEALSPAVPYGSIEEDVFYSWFNPLYLAPDVQSDIRKRFEEDSEIELTDFLKEEKYEELMKALQTGNITWKQIGPANKSNYFAASKDELPVIVSEYMRVIHSDALFLVLSNLTGLKLHPLAPSGDDENSANGNQSSDTVPNGGVTNPRCRSEVRKWEYGCYTLARDTDSENFEFALDTMLYIGCEKDWSFENGGYTSYIAKEEDEELLSVGPAENSLALVYRDRDTVRFVKHLNHRVTKLTPPRFFEISCVYYE